MNKDLSSSRRGDLAELIAVQGLMERGFEVFRNVSCVGPADLVAWNILKPDNPPQLIDVKSVRLTEDNLYDLDPYNYLNEKQLGLDVEILLVDKSRNRMLGSLNSSLVRSGIIG